MSHTITVKVHRVSGFAAGQEVPVTVDDEGTPLDQFWRRRLRDAKRDQCCEVLTLHEEYESPSDEDWEDEEPES